MQLIINLTVTTRKQTHDAYARYLWAYMKYLIRICTDENKLRRAWNILKEKKDE